jgi:hypothetical protein
MEDTLGHVCCSTDLHCDTENFGVSTSICSPPRSSESNIGDTISKTIVESQLQCCLEQNQRKKKRNQCLSCFFSYSPFLFGLPHWFQAFQMDKPF